MILVIHTLKMKCLFTNYISGLIMLQTTPVKRVNNVLLFIILLTAILHFGRDILILLMFSAFLAMLMAPVSNKLEAWGFSRVLSTLISVLIILTFVVALLLLISSQFAALSEDLPNIQKKIESSFSSLKAWLGDKFSLSQKELMTTMEDQAKNLTKNAGGFIAGIIKGIATTIASSLLVLVLTFLFLLKREKYEEFFVMLNKSEQRNEIKEIIHKISGIAQQYLIGRAISIIILTIFYTTGLLILGIKNAFLLSAIAAIVTFIPYVGPLVGGLLPIGMALVTEDSLGPALGVAIVISLAQVIDNYFIEPYIVGGNVNVSPFFTIFILIVGGMVWGLAGVILFLPLLGMVKIIFDNVSGLQPYAYLIGDQKEASTSEGLWKKIKKRFSKEK